MFFAFSLAIFAQTPPLNVTYKGNITYSEQLSDVWGYVTPGGNEYALVGVFSGISIVDIADPENPTEVFFVQNGVSSGWRDIKTWGEYAYAINETGNGLMVIDLSDLPNSVDTWNWQPSIPGLGTITTCHNIWIDEFGYAYLVGCNVNNGGMLYVDVFTTPGSPVYVDKGPPNYNHDVYVRDNIAYSSELYLGQFAIYDISDKHDTQLKGTQTTLNEFTHNAWLSDDGNTLYTTDEVANGTVGAYDISDPANIEVLDNFQPYETLGDGVIPHNAHVWQDWLIVSYYTDGCILVDGSRPDNLVEVGNFDTFIPTSTGFAGAWGAYPYLPSGLILISDMGNGLYVLEPNYVSACWLEGEITDASNGNGINDASLELLTTNVLEYSAPSGEYKTGFAVAGTYDVLVKKPGYEPATAQAVLVNGEVTILNVELTPLTPISVSGLVVDEDTNDPVPNAIVSIANDDFNYDILTDDNGLFNIAAFFEGDYDIYAGKWGYNTSGTDSMAIDANNNALTISIKAGYEDVFSLDLGWTSEDDNFQGSWERGVPFGTYIPNPGIFISPPEDVVEDIGNHCYVTGNTADINAGILLGGNTFLTSPLFDVEDYGEPYLSYNTWYLNAVSPTQVGTTDFLIKLSNGTESVYIDTISYPSFDLIEWEYAEFNIAEYLTPTDSMSITFEAYSPFDFSEATEAGVDYFQVWDNDPPVGTKDLVDISIKLNAYPNPSNYDFVVKYDLETISNDSRLMIYNTLGQLVESVQITDPIGKIRVGDRLEKGIYFAHIANGNSISQSLKLIKQ